ncbi:hypothetical protein BCR36DRAFT_584648 [Piromyces finnis]|uniref:Steroid 5-alpha reductase C-terminal domain-containing protein n=1 Tax=Piromyces finnis TaxID=1754191 RepID=A0A1Y1V5U2_9FUNG|nr:hypothetical protein BCR36DRAFT_584648 [Piromyces finnis]|eukprot:ORX47536.1 hypothetical protein BCR36DRAFT_584648 [Piromyces finnis]
MDRGMEEESDDENDEVEEEVTIDENGEEVVTEKRKLLNKKKDKYEGFSDKEKKEMEKYLASSPDQDIIELINTSGLYQYCRYPEFLAYLMIFTAFTLLYTSNIFSLPIISSILIYIILIRVTELDAYHKSLLLDHEKEWSEYTAKTKKFIPFIY